MSFEPAASRQCPACGAHALFTAEFCSSCLATLDGRRAAGTSYSLPAEPVATCPSHVDRPAAGSCDRCGSFYCIVCVPSAATLSKATCPACAQLQAQTREATLPDGLFKEISISYLVIGALIVGIPLAPWALGADEGRVERLILVAAAAALFGVPLLATGVALLLARRLWLAWVGLAIEAVPVLGVTALLLLNGKLSLGLLLMAAIPVVTAWRIQKLADALTSKRKATQAAAAMVAI